MGALFDAREAQTVFFCARSLILLADVVMWKVGGQVEAAARYL